MRKINPSENWFFEKINEIEKHLYKLREKKDRNYLKNERGKSENVKAL